MQLVSNPTQTKGVYRSLDWPQSNGKHWVILGQDPKQPFNGTLDFIIEHLKQVDETAQQNWLEQSPLCAELYPLIYSLMKGSPIWLDLAGDFRPYFKQNLQVFLADSLIKLSLLKHLQYIVISTSPNDDTQVIWRHFDDHASAPATLVIRATADSHGQWQTLPAALSTSSQPRSLGAVPSCVEWDVSNLSLVLASAQSLLSENQKPLNDWSTRDIVNLALACLTQLCDQPVRAIVNELQHRYGSLDQLEHFLALIDSEIFLGHYPIASQICQDLLAQHAQDKVGYLRILLKYLRISIHQAKEFPTDFLEYIFDHTQAAEFNNDRAYLLSNYAGIVTLKPVNPQQELAWLKEAIRLYRQQKNLLGLAVALHSQARLLQRIDRRQSAARAYKLGLELRQRIGMKARENTLMNGLGYFYAYIDRFEDANYYFQLVYNRLKTLSPTEELGATLYNIAWVKLLQGEEQQALNSIDQVLTMITQQQISSIPFKTDADLLAFKGFILARIDETEAAARIIEQLDHAKTDSSPFGDFFQTLLRAIVYAQQGNSILAEVNFKFLPQQIHEYNTVDLHFEPLYLREYCRFLQKNGRQSEYLHHKRQGMKYCRSNQLPETLKWFQGVI